MLCKTHFSRLFSCLKFVTLMILIIGYKNSFGYTVTDLKATYQNGQVFLTWTNASASNLQYNVYRSTSKFTNSSQVTSAKLLGFVRDKSAKDVHHSMETNQDVYFKISNNGQPLTSSQGLYVVTCTDNKTYYYAVTVSTLVPLLETKTITVGKNSLGTGVVETVTTPQPVFQDSTLQAGEMKIRYTQFTSNQETALYPAMNSTGSYGFDFYLVKRGSSSSYPLFMVYEGEGADAGGGVSLDATITDCYVLGVDDWLPIPDGNGGIGDNTHYSGYHEKFNIYSNLNPVPVSGIVKMYTQRRYIQAMHWVKAHFPIDASRIYLKGTSATGFGAMLTANIIPEEIAAVYAVVEPVSIGTNGESVLEQMWGLGASKLNTDIIDLNSGAPIPFTKASDLRKLVGINEYRDLPLFFDVHGKNDNSVTWTSGKIDWYDSLEMNHAGGTFYWDQREHNGTNKDFEPEETTPDFYRYQNTKSYPAFSNCTIDQNPGNGSPKNGDPYGAINGYLDWEDDITDEACDYSINLMVKTMYVGGEPDPDQYSTCSADVTFRRLQNFKPADGDKVTWKNYNSTGKKIQNGSVTFKGGFITLKNITINKSGNKIELTLDNCQRTMKVTAEAPYSEPYFSRSANGYTAHVELTEAEELNVYLYDLLGRRISQQKIMMNAGVNTFEIPSPGTGLFLIELKGESLTHAEKLLF